MPKIRLVVFGGSPGLPENPEIDIRVYLPLLHRAGPSGSALFFSVLPDAKEVFSVLRFLFLLLSHLNGRIVYLITNV